MNRVLAVVSVCSFYTTLSALATGYYQDATNVAWVTGLSMLWLGLRQGGRVQ